MRKILFTLALAYTSLCMVFSAIVANPIISRGKPVYTSSGKVQYLNDDKFNTTSFNVSNNSWIAVKVDAGPTKVFLNWNNPVYAWSNELAAASCPNTTSFPVDYNLLTSANSTNGADGDWTIADSIRGNIVTARGHLINFTGASWVKMQIIKGGGQIDEVEVFDVSDKVSDVWFFAGTSISANAFKGTPPSQTFADLVTRNNHGYYPAMIRGGIGCITSNDLVNNLSKYLKMAGNVHFWAIEMGTNDAWNNGSSNVTTFKNNLQKVIDSCKAYHIQPIIAHVLATNYAITKWQVDTSYYKAVNDLTIKNHLIPGPDLYSYFLAHPKELNSDGVHPSAVGATSIQRLWAQKMDSLYKCLSIKIAPYLKINKGQLIMKDSATLIAGDTIILSPVVSTEGGIWSWAGPNNFSASSHEILLDTIQTIQAGNYYAIYETSDSCSSSYAFNIAVKVKVGVNVPIIYNGASIFPNPNEGGKFKILLNNLSSLSQASIYNMQGKLVYNTFLISKETIINADLSEGIYLIKIVNGHNVLDQKLIIK